MATLRSASLKNVLTVSGLHADSEPVGLAPFSVIWLKSSLHFAAFIRLGMSFGVYPKILARAVVRWLCLRFDAGFREPRFRLL